MRENSGILSTMSDHAILGAMLVLSLLLTAWGLSFVFRAYRKSERIEGIVAAIYLEARKILESRSR